MPIYLDYNATSPVAPEVADAISVALADTFGNPSSVHRPGQQARAALDAARDEVAALVGGEPAEVVFTSGGTESDNCAIRGVAEAFEDQGRRHIVTTAIEHEAVLNTVKALARRGWRVTVLPVGADGVVDPESLRAVVASDTVLVSAMHANNETGVVQPIAELAGIARQAGALFHTDAVQSVGRLAVDAHGLGVDLLSLSAHKIGGPKGAGALWVRRGTRLVSTMTGGRQERNRRAGTENVPALVGFGVAARLARTRLDREASRLVRLRDRLERAVLAQIAGTAVNGDPARRLPNTSNISFDGVEAEALLIALDLEGIAVSTGSACSSGTLEPSHVLRAMGLAPHRVQSSLRFSLGMTTSEAEIDAVVELLPRLVARLRRVASAAVRT